MTTWIGHKVPTKCIPNILADLTGTPEEAYLFNLLWFMRFKKNCLQFKQSAVSKKTFLSFCFVELSTRNIQKSWWMWMRIHLQKIFFFVLPVSGTKMAGIEGCCNNKRQQKYGRRNAWICHIFNYTASKEAWLGLDGIVKGFCKIIYPKYSKHWPYLMTAIAAP